MRAAALLSIDPILFPAGVHPWMDRAWMEPGRWARGGGPAARGHALVENSRHGLYDVDVGLTVSVRSKVPLRHLVVIRNCIGIHQCTSTYEYSFSYE